ncbi:hypothetical protein SCB49_12950 [unidentified eubacterium SCB49]|nr:hypothetical protein SCB49_12950 [unidentified eubacterium SCB49]
MKIASLTQDLTYQDLKPSISVLFETNSTKEIRIVFKKGQQMKAHKTPFPIVVEIFKGAISFGVNNTQQQMLEGSLIFLEGDVLHDLTAEEDSIVRLSLSKNDSVSRVKKVKTV